VKTEEDSWNFEEGETLLIDKPLHWTSFDVVNKLRFALKGVSKKKLKVGHAGTLDPLATGLLIVCTGKMTKQIDSIQAQEKEYTGTLTLGATTPSYDRETEIDQRFEISAIDEVSLRNAVNQFIGEIDQRPPAFSAKKMQGKKAYELARKGVEVNLRTNRVNIYSFELTNIQLPEVSFRVRCSKGTYIRSLAHDFGAALNNGAYLSELRRTAIGEYPVSEALSVEDMTDLIRSIGS